MTRTPHFFTRPALSGLLLLSLGAGLAGAQSTPPAVQPPVTPTNTAPALPVTPPVPPVAPNTSRLYAGFSVAPSLSGGGTAYGLVIGSTQVIGPFGAQLDAEYDTKAAALSVDVLALYRPVLGGSLAKLLPYAGAGLGLTSSPSATLTDPSKPATDPVNVGKTATDYAAQVVAGTDYLLTDSIAAGAELSYRTPFSNKGNAAGGGTRARVSLKFLF
jgi:opacity protein-like surface antigen